MSLNFCDENPDQSTSNYHCWHPVKVTKQKRGLVFVTMRCCWCGDLTEESRNVHHGNKAKVMP